MFSERIAALAADHESGASTIVARALAILGDAFAAGADVTSVARAVVRAQPSMAPVWNAAVAALGGPATLKEFAHAVAGAPEAMRRVARDHFAAAPPRHIVTLSYSGSVAFIIETLDTVHPLRVTCSESAPAMEGRALARRLTDGGVATTCVSDEAIAESAPSADLVLVGADGVAAEWFLNKTGTRMLTARAAAARIPVYVAASLDKFAAAAVAARLAPHPWFEPAPLREIAGVISEDGVRDADAVRHMCERLDGATPDSVLACLIAG